MKIHILLPTIPADGNRRWSGRFRATFALLSLALAITLPSVPCRAQGAQVAESQSIQPKHDWINVKTDFGAVGNGLANDTAAFAHAIAAFEASQTAAWVLVPPGTYLVDDVKVVGNLCLKGSGKERTILKARTPGAGSGIVRRDANDVVQQLTVEDLQLQGFQYGIDARAVYYSEFRNLYIVNCDTGILMGHRATEPPPSGPLTLADAFIDVRMRGTTSFSVDVDVSTSGDQVNACQFHSCVFEGRPLRLHGNGGNGLVGISFHGCTLQDASLVLSQCNGIGWYGGYIEGSSIDAAGSVGGLTISGAYFQVAGGSGVRLGTNTGGQVRGVTIGACTFTSASSGGTGIEIRPDMGDDSYGIVILPNHYLGSITGISDPGKHAEVTVTAGAIAAKGHVSFSNTDARVLAGSSPPNGNVAAPVGSLYLRTSGGGSSTLYVKESGGSTNAGWVAK